MDEGKTVDINDRLVLIPTEHGNEAVRYGDILRISDSADGKGSRVVIYREIGEASWPFHSKFVAEDLVPHINRQLGIGS